MQKDASYHKAAIQYNEELADFAEGLADRLDHEEVSRWCRSISRQHKFHAGRHKKALSKLEEDPMSIEDDEDVETAVVDDIGIVHRSAETGEFVSSDYAEDNPSTTVTETIPKAEGDIHNPFEVKNTDAAPDASQAAEPVENQGESA